MGYDLRKSGIVRQQAKLPRVFVCSPYRGETRKNVENARKYCRFVYQQGGIPFAPHLLYPQFLDDTKWQERDAGITFGLDWMRSCQEVWCFGMPTQGMITELGEARRLGLHVRFFDARMREAYRDE